MVRPQLALRVPHILLWIVDAYVIASPVYIAWQYNVHATPFFRIKYLFTQRPLLIVLILLIVVWLGGALTLHAIEFALEPNLGLCTAWP